MCCGCDCAVLKGECRACGVEEEERCGFVSGWNSVELLKEEGGGGREQRWKF